jgi:hypothetical protein
LQPSLDSQKWKSVEVLLARLMPFLEEPVTLRMAGFLAVQYLAAWVLLADFCRRPQSAPVLVNRESVQVVCFLFVWTFGPRGDHVFGTRISRIHVSEQFRGLVNNRVGAVVGACMVPARGNWSSRTLVCRDIAIDDETKGRTVAANKATLQLLYSRKQSHLNHVMVLAALLGLQTPWTARRRGRAELL